MSLPEQQAELLAGELDWLRMEDYIGISLFSCYIYYVFTTLDEEISVIRPQRWTRGKTLYMIIRYGMLVYIVLKFGRDFKNYLHVSPIACKALAVVSKVAYGIVHLACDFLLGLCLSALIQAKPPLFIAILVLCLALPFIYTVLDIAGTIQYPGKAKSISPMKIEHGYSCYPITYMELSQGTIAHAGEGVRVHLSLASIALLTIMGVFTLVVKYRAQAGRLLQVVRRDGGIHYLSVLAVRLAFAIIHSYSSLPNVTLEYSPPIMALYVAADVFIPILAQRLLLNMRKVDFVETEPVASKLFFASPVPFQGRLSNGNKGAQDSLGVALPLQRRGGSDGVP